MKKLIRKIPKSILITQSIFFILWIVVIPRYLVYLFHAWIFKFYWIPEQFITLDYFLYIITIQYFLVIFLAYLSVLFLWFFILSIIIFQFINEKKNNNLKNHIYISFLLIIALLVILLSVSKIELLTFLIFSSTLSLIIIIKFFFKNYSFYCSFWFYIYSWIIFLLIFLINSTGYFLDLWEKYASDSNKNNEYNIIEIHWNNYIILQYNDEHFIAKEIINWELDSSYTIFNISEIEWTSINKWKILNY